MKMCALEEKVDPKANTSIQVGRGARKDCPGKCLSN